jgi:hypothetical protein
MATNIAKLTKYAGGRDVWGGHGVFFCNYTGPASYQGGALGGDIVDAIGGLSQLSAANTPLRNIDNISPSNSISGTFRIEAYSLSLGPSKRWLLRWFTIATAAEVANTTNLSAESAIITVIGG